jgi:hypothetical protein
MTGNDQPHRDPAAEARALAPGGMMPRHRIRQVVCRNPDCLFNGKARTAATLEVGNHLFIGAPIVCSCGNEVDDVEPG